MSNVKQLHEIRINRFLINKNTYSAHGEDGISTYYNIMNMILEITVVHKKWILQRLLACHTQSGPHTAYE